jgi:hypothetical protein
VEYAKAIWNRPNKPLKADTGYQFWTSLPAASGYSSVTVSVFSKWPFKAFVGIPVLEHRFNQKLEHGTGPIFSTPFTPALSAAEGIPKLANVISALRAFRAVGAALRVSSQRVESSSALETDKMVLHLRAPLSLKVLASNLFQQIGAFSIIPQEGPVCP